VAMELAHARHLIPSARKSRGGSKRKNALERVAFQHGRQVGGPEPRRMGCSFSSGLLKAKEVLFRLFLAAPQRVAHGILARLPAHADRFA